VDPRVGRRGSERVKLNKMIGLVDGTTAPRVLMGLLMLATTAVAQTDDVVVKRFVGKWEGEISNLRALDDLTLIIKSMERQGNAWSVEGAMGPPGRMARFTGTVEVIGADLVLKFRTADGPVELTLWKDGKYLFGFNFRFGPGGGRELPMKFEKVP
jgi:hypothetical protein